MSPEICPLTLGYSAPPPLETESTFVRATWTIMKEAPLFFIPQLSAYRDLRNSLSQKDTAKAYADTARSILNFVPIVGSALIINEGLEKLCNNFSNEALLTLGLGVAGFAFDITGFGIFMKTVEVASAHGLLQYLTKETIHIFNPWEMLHSVNNFVKFGGHVLEGSLAVVISDVNHISHDANIGDDSLFTNVRKLADSAHASQKQKVHASINALQKKLIHIRDPRAITAIITHLERFTNPQLLNGCINIFLRKDVETFLVDVRKIPHPWIYRLMEPLHTNADADLCSVIASFEEMNVFTREEIKQQIDGATQKHLLIGNSTNTHPENILCALKHVDRVRALPLETRKKLLLSLIRFWSTTDCTYWIDDILQASDREIQYNLALWSNNREEAMEIYATVRSSMIHDSPIFELWKRKYLPDFTFPSGDFLHDKNSGIGSEITGIAQYTLTSPHLKSEPWLREHAEEIDALDRTLDGYHGEGSIQI